MPQTPLLGSSILPGVPVTGSTVGFDGTGSGSPAGDVQSELDRLETLIGAVTHVTFQEVDGSPSVVAATVQVPNDSLDVSGATALLNYQMRHGGGRGALDQRSVSGAVTIDLLAYNAFQLTLTGSITITLSNPPPAGVDAFWAFAFVQGGTGSYTVTWPASVKWRASDGTNTGTAPTLVTAVGGQDDFDLSTSDGGTTYGATPGTAAGFTAGGDLTGSSTNQTVAKINGSPLGSLASPVTGDRLRWNGTAWVNSALIWTPVTVYDGTHWLPLVDGSGNAIMAEA